MEFLACRAGVILAAVVLDRLLGDPRWLPHPVRLIGLLIKTGERLLLGKGDSPLFHPVDKLPAKKAVCPLFRGCVLAAGVVGLSGFGVWLAVEGAYRGGLWWGLAAETVLVWLAIAPRSLADEALAVDRLLSRGDLPGARERLSMIVGRDTADLDEGEIRRAAVETVSENTVDGVLCPLFYAAVFGPVGAWVYKAISTLDSMVGYRSERYLEFGRCGARLDDAAAFLPARLSLCLVPPAALLCGMSARNSWRVGWRDRLAHSSPNAGHGEALFAGALGVRLGGPSTYGGRRSQKPHLSAEFPPPGPDAVRRAVRLMWAVTRLASAQVGTVLFAWTQGGTVLLAW